jgi:hypothetical protein
MPEVRATALVIALCATLSAGCASREEAGVAIYLKHDLGSSGPPGQIAPVLAPVLRGVPKKKRTPAEVLALLRRGPTTVEARKGFLPTIPITVRILGVRVSKGTATVNLGGNPARNWYTHAAIVFSLTDLPGIRAVALRYHGRPCCLYNLQSKIATQPLTRSLYHGWPGEPCAFRMYPDAVKCRSL